MNSLFKELNSAPSLKDKSKNLIFYIADTQFSNLGDLIINKTLMERLRNYGKLIIDDRGVPDWYCKQLGLSADERASYYGINGLILAWLCGFRGLFQRNVKTYLIIPPGHASSKNKGIKPKIVISSIYFLFLRLVGGRICRFGVSIGPFSQLRAIAEVINSKLMYFYSVRDSISENYGRQIGIQNVNYFPDMAWFMEPPKSADIPTSNLPLLVDGEYVIFSFRKLSQRGFETLPYGEDLYKSLDAIVELVCKKWSKKLVLSYQVSSDYDFCKEMAQRYQDSYDVVLIDQKIDGQSMYELYSGASMIFSNRLHALMFSLIYGALPIAVFDPPRHDKIVGIFLDAGLKQLILDINQGDRVVESLPSLIAEADQIKQQIALYREQTVKAADELMKQVMSGKKVS